MRVARIGLSEDPTFQGRSETEEVIDIWGITKILEFGNVLEYFMDANNSTVAGAGWNRRG